MGHGPEFTQRLALHAAAGTALRHTLTHHRHHWQLIIMMMWGPGGKEPQADEVGPLLAGAGEALPVLGNWQSIANASVAGGRGQQSSTVRQSNYLMSG